MKKEKQEGEQAWIDNRFNAINPYPINSAKAIHWYRGYDNAMQMELYGYVSNPFGKGE